MKMKLLEKLYPNRQFRVQNGEVHEKTTCGDDPSKGMVWTLCGQTVSELVAARLGFDPSIGFVTVERGRVGFSSGKPEEIKSLFRKCNSFGVPMSKGLRSCK